MTRTRTQGVEAVAVHGGKDQMDRIHAIDSFKKGTAVSCAVDRLV